ncbi:hypothetical protein JCM6292_259 [Bacteroides pyogenes JCM 6292]|uniref:Uncharacterized protein n=1 Tax=Bacteroides pyogenes JCM 6292 TaxID=1235809 RepID=W4P3D8_9BACE|nr:hypothetical protein JCM6292_259 [Bacteroides pyogenes JCM 6292]
MIRFFFAAAVYLSLSGKRMLLLLQPNSALLPVIGFRWKENTAFTATKQRIASGDWL